MAGEKIGAATTAAIDEALDVDDDALKIRDRIAG